MFKEYPEIEGHEIKKDQLKNRRSKEIISGIYNFQSLIEIISIRRNTIDDEILILKFLLDIPNAPVIDIKMDEYVAIVTSTSDPAGGPTSTLASGLTSISDCAINADGRVNAKVANKTLINLLCISGSPF